MADDADRAQLEIEAEITQARLAAQAGFKLSPTGHCSASIRNGTWRQLELPVHPTAFGCASALAFAPRFCFEAASAR